MKLNFIEKPRGENLVAKNAFTSLLTDGEMSSLFGGDIGCTVYDTTCGSGNGKNLCREFTDTNCKNVKTCNYYVWLAPTELVTNSNYGQNLSIISNSTN